MSDGIFRFCDAPECENEIPHTAPCFRLTHCHIVIPQGNPALVTGFPEQDLGIFCSVRCLRRFVGELDDFADKTA